MPNTTTLTPAPLPRGWSFKRYSITATDVDREFNDWLAKHWDDSAKTCGMLNDGWVCAACETLAERFATAIMGLQHAIECDLLVELFCEQDVTLRSPAGNAIEYKDLHWVLYAATRSELNRRQGGRPYHPTHEAGKAVAA